MSDKEKVIEDFADMLESHDWAYERSDDDSVYQKGKNQYQALMAFIKIHDEYLEELFTMYREANPFNNNKTII